MRVIVPYEQDVPRISVPSRAKYDCCIDPRIIDEDVLVARLRGSSILYTSNAEATSNIAEKGTGHGKQPSPFAITKRVLDQIDCCLLHPLPASGELTSEAFNHPRSLIVPQMRNKVSVIASLTAHLMAQRGYMDI